MQQETESWGARMDRATEAGRTAREIACRVCPELMEDVPSGEYSAAGRSLAERDICTIRRTARTASTAIEMLAALQACWGMTGRCNSPYSHNSKPKCTGQQAQYPQWEFRREVLREQEKRLPPECRPISCPCGNLDPEEENRLLPLADSRKGSG